MNDALAAGGKGVVAHRADATQNETVTELEQVEVPALHTR
ncbi:hypothetical protein BH24GEM1_BH24GEM1_09250 [soil metagenome]